VNQNETMKVSEARAPGNAQREPAKAVLQCPLCGGSEISEFLSAPDRFHLRAQKYRLTRCNHCTCVWLVSPPLPEEMSHHYSEDYHNAIVKAGETSAATRWERQRDMISRFKKGGAILDIGCSSGGFLSTLNTAKWKLHGIEIAPETAEKARLATGAEVFIGEATEAPFLPNSFDVITCFDVLEHVYDPRQFLSKVQEWLKPGGIYYVMLPNIDSWESRMFGSYWYGLELPRHLFHFSPKSLSNVMNSLGFREVNLLTPRTCYVERSVNYAGAEIASKFGFEPTSQAQAKERSIAWRAIRKVLRLSFIFPFSQVASWAGAGGSMEAVFAKPTETRSVGEAV
jgi:2-polyprenyl-3-methyl-5-hydroxy-6-metoxy-1,4-benzoquinol methylase